MNQSKKKTKVTLDMAELLDKESCPRDMAEGQKVAIEYFRHTNSRDALIVEKNDRIQELTEDFDAKIAREKNIIDRLARRLKLFALNFREELFKEKKSYTFMGVRLSFHKSPGKVNIIGGKKEADIVDGLLTGNDKELAKRFLSFKPTLDKEEIKSAWEEGPEMRELLRRINLEVIAPEEFDAKVVAKETAPGKDVA